MLIYWIFVVHALYNSQAASREGESSQESFVRKEKDKMRLVYRTYIYVCFICIVKIYRVSLVSMLKSFNRYIN